MILLRRFAVLALVLVIFNADAQVSSGEGFSPMEGVAIPKAQISQPQAVKPGAVFKDCDDCPEMVVIPAGSFMMGSPSNPEPDPFSNAKPVMIGKENEKPQHMVQVNSFAIAIHLINQEEWFALMGNNPSTRKGRTLPVENVTWYEAQSYLLKLNKKSGNKYRLPSEAEWEYAAKQANQFDSYSIFGEFLQWTQDCSNDNYRDAPSDGSAWTSGDCSLRALRGGSRRINSRTFRSIYSNGYPSTNGEKSFGFRVAREF